MASTVYALLVAIDDYQSPVSPLRGCVADSKAMHAFLASRVGGENHKLDAVVLRNEEATRPAVIENFLQHLGQAGPEDTALFCYSGHGSQAPTAPEFYHLEPDRLEETLVCYDSRLPGNYDLADKEIAKLIAEVAKNDPHIVLILDSCHSGSATRNIESTGVRRVPTDDRQRPVSEYFVTPSELQALEQTRSDKQSQNGWVKLPQGRHIVLSACQSDEEAKEIPFDGQDHGVFSYYLLETLQSATSIWSYRDLFSRVNSMVRSLVSRQSPLIEATDFSDLDRPFLGGAVQSHTPYFTVSFDDRAGWVIDGGTIHGIPAVQDDDTTHLAVFPVDAANLEATGEAVGNASVTERQSTRCTVELSLNDDTEPDMDTIYKAVITSLPISALGVKLEGDADAVEMVRSILTASASGQSIQVREVTNGEELRLVARDDSYRLSRAGDDRPLNAIVEGYSNEKARMAVEYLEHIGRWMRMADLHNPASALPANAVTMDCYIVGNNGTEELSDLATRGTDLKLFYEYRDQEWYRPEIKLKLTNNSTRPLYCMLFDLTDRFKISSRGLLPGGGIRLEPGEETWAYDRNPIPVSVPDELWNEGMTEYKDLLKVVASTEACDATRFEQGNLGVRFEPHATRSAQSNTLERLMQRTMTRDLGGERNRRENLVDWTTAELTITTVRPLEGVSLPAAGQDTPLSPQVTLNGHPELTASVSLSTTPLASRDMSGAPQLPSWLRDDPAQVQPLNLSPSRSVEAGLSVLELNNVSNYQAVTPEHPLTLRLEANLKPEDHVLTIAYDPESDFYLPLGRATHSEGGVEVQIERLPAPASSSRSLTGSIKIFFQKVISEKFGADFDYPLLAMVDAGGGYNPDLEEIRDRVTGSSTILLYVHGITGDTRGMVKSAFKPGPDDSQTPLGEKYDLVLAFDYENLNTEIQDNAQALKERLEQVGLGADHGKSLHVVAHSMGGLVSRWFIEHLGGNKVVQHLVMLGTPNGGSPWSTVEDWVVGAIGIGLNGLATMVWPVKALANLMDQFERAVGVSLAQMEDDSRLLQDLAASPDPGVRYSVIAGNTSLLADLLNDGDGESPGRIQRLFKKLNLQRVLYATASLAFFKKPNDIAASVTSISRVPGFENLDKPHEIACDHMTYFTNEAGLKALNEALK